MRDFRNLTVWRKAHAFVLAVYRATRRFPDEERYGLTSQARRSAVSVSANLAEGWGRFGDRERARFVSIASGSLSECRCHLLVSQDLG